jgi:hypothetical protein
MLDVLSHVFGKENYKCGLHAPTKWMSAPAAISSLPPVKPKSGVHTHTHRQNRYQRYKITSDHMNDECAPALRINPAYLPRGSPASRRHVGGRSNIFVVSASCTAWPLSYKKYEYHRYRHRHRHRVCRCVYARPKGLARI